MILTYILLLFIAAPCAATQQQEFNDTNQGSVSITIPPKEELNLFDESNSQTKKLNFPLKTLEIGRNITLGASGLCCFGNTLSTIIKYALNILEKPNKHFETTSDVLTFTTFGLGFIALTLHLTSLLCCCSKEDKKKEDKTTKIDKQLEKLF